MTNYDFLKDGLQEDEVKEFEKQLLNIDVAELSDEAKKIIEIQYFELHESLLQKWENSDQSMIFAEYVGKELANSELNSKKIQLYLSLKGYYNGEIDGGFGESSKQALEKSIKDSYGNFDQLNKFYSTIVQSEKPIIDKATLQKLIKLMKKEGFHLAGFSGKSERSEIKQSIYKTFEDILYKMLENGILIENEEDIYFLMEMGYEFEDNLKFSDIEGKVVSIKHGRQLEVVNVWLGENNSHNDNQLVFEGDNRHLFVDLCENLPQYFQEEVATLEEMLPEKSKVQSPKSKVEEETKKEEKIEYEDKNIQDFVDILKQFSPNFKESKGVDILNKNISKYKKLIEKEYPELLAVDGISFEKHFAYFLAWAEENGIKNYTKEYMRAFLDTLVENINKKSNLDKSEVDQSDPGFLDFKRIIFKDYPDLFTDKEGLTIEEHYLLFKEQYGENFRIIDMHDYLKRLQIRKGRKNAGFEDKGKSVVDKATDYVKEKIDERKQRRQKDNVQDQSQQSSKSSQSSSTIRDEVFKHKEPESKTTAYRSGGNLENVSFPEYDLIRTIEKRHPGNFLKKPFSIYSVTENNEYSFGFSPVEKRLAYEAELNPKMTVKRQQEIINFFDNLSNKVAQYIIKETGTSDIDIAVGQLKSTEKGKKQIMKYIARAMLDQNIVYKEEESLLKAFNPNSHYGNVVHLDCNLLVEGFMHIGQNLGLPLHMVLEQGHAYVIWDDNRHSFEIEATKFRKTDIKQEKEGARFKIYEHLTDQINQDNFISGIGWHKKQKLIELGKNYFTSRDQTIIQRNGYYQPIVDNSQLEDLIKMTLGSDYIKDLLMQIDTDNKNSSLENKLLQSYKRDISIAERSSNPYVIRTGFDLYKNLAKMYIKRYEFEKARSTLSSMDVYQKRNSNYIGSEENPSSQFRDTISVLTNKKKLGLKIKEYNDIIGNLRKFYAVVPKEVQKILIKYQGYETDYQSMLNCRNELDSVVSEVHENYLKFQELYINYFQYFQDNGNIRRQKQQIENFHNKTIMAPFNTVTGILNSL